MPTDSSSASVLPIEAVLSALDRLAGDLHRRVEPAERRAEAAEKQVHLEREARHSAEARAAHAEQSVRDTLRRAEAIETIMQDSMEQLRRDLLAEIGEAVNAAHPTTAVNQAPAELRHFSTERPERPYSARLDPELAYIPQPTAGRMSESAQPATRQWGKERGYAWVEDEPGPSWWRRPIWRY